MILEGAALAVLIVFLFLNSWRSTVITALTLPISIIGTMIVLFVLGFSLNMMTLMALSLSVGILIDDAIVVRENIMRHLHMGKGHVRRRSTAPTRSDWPCWRPRCRSSRCSCRLPSWTASWAGSSCSSASPFRVAVLISLFVAFTLDPMMCSVWDDPDFQPTPGAGPQLYGRSSAA